MDIVRSGEGSSWLPLYSLRLSWADFCALPKFFCGNLLMGRRNLRYACPGKKNTTEAFRTEVDFEQVLYRLALHAQSLFTDAACLGRAQVVLPGGDSVADLASATLLKLLDPLDTSVTWSSTKGPPTTAGVLAYLREVVRRDFFDFVRSKRATTRVYPGDERADGNAGYILIDLDHA
jgi:hypothetical protein